MRSGTTGWGIFPVRHSNVFGTFREIFSFTRSVRKSYEINRTLSFYQIQLLWKKSMWKTRKFRFTFLNIDPVRGPVLGFARGRSWNFRVHRPRIRNVLYALRSFMASITVIVVRYRVRRSARVYKKMWRLRDEEVENQSRVQYLHIFA